MVGAIGQTNSADKHSQLQFLQQRLDEIKAEQGILGSCWNDLKEKTNIGQSAQDCESKLEAYENGEVSFEEAVEYINDFEKKQHDVTNLATNILTGVGAIATTVATAGTGTIGLGVAMATGAPIGAALKTGLNFFERATNNIDNDAFDIKEMAKDAITGATTGATSAISSGVGAGIRTGQIGLSILNGTKCGAACGAASGAIGYVSDVIFDDREFKFGDLTKSTLTSSLVSGTVGAAVGGGLYGIASVNGTVMNTEATKSTLQTIVADSASSSTRKVLGQAERNIIAA